VSDLEILPVLLTDPPEEKVACRIVLGLTVYIDTTKDWHRGGAAAVLDRTIELFPGDVLGWATSSALTHWRRVTDRDRRELRQGLVAGHQARQRHLLEIRLADNPLDPRFAFTYREIDTERAHRAGVIQITCPAESDPAPLLALARLIGDTGALWSGVGGFLGRWSEPLRAMAFDGLYAWCRRYLGVDIQQTEPNAWAATRGLLAVGWLNLIGRALADKLAPALAAKPSWTEPITLEERKEATLIAAGQRPTLGDVNHFESCAAYEELHRVLLPGMQPLPRMLGEFLDGDNTERWSRRYIDPRKWLD
jgi:hypothetical protein